MLRKNLKKYYLERLEPISKSLNDSEDGYCFKVDLRDLFFEFFEDLPKLLPDIDELSSIIKHYQGIDISTLKTAIAELDKLDQNKTYNHPSGDEFNLKENLDLVKKAIEVLEKSGVELGKLEVGLRFELGIDSRFSQILLVVNDEDIYSQFVRLAEDKAKYLTDNQTAEVWSRFVKEAESPEFMADKDVVDSSFWTPTTIEQTQKNIARYVMEIRPKMIRGIIENKREIDGIPISGIGIGKMLSWLEPNNTREISRKESVLLNSLSRVLFLIKKKYTGEELNTANEILGFDFSGKIVCSDFDRMEEQDLEDTKYQVFNGLIYEFKKMLSIADFLKDSGLPLLEVLNNYKMRLMIDAKKERERILLINEKQIQKELGAHLISQKYLPYGKEFGHNALDLVVYDMHETIGLEVKIFKNKSSQAKLQAALVQLQSYLNDVPGIKRGILVIYNLSTWVIDIQMPWIKGRFGLCVINLLEETPSRRDKSITIEEGTEKKLVKISEIAPPKKKKRRSRKKSVS